MHRPGNFTKAAFLLALAALTTPALAGEAVAPGLREAGNTSARPVATRLRPIAQDDASTRLYIVQMAAPPAVAVPELREGDGFQSVAGTERQDRKRASAGRAGRFDARAGAVQDYAAGLMQRHDRVLDRVGAGDGKIYSYRYAFNGFAARLTPAQAQKLRTRKDVRNVWQSRTKHAETNDSPGFLGLTAADGGLRNDLGLRGEGVVIGIIDSGISPGHPSFKDTREPDMPRLCRSTWSEGTLLGRWLCHRYRKRAEVLLYPTKPADWKGVCETGEGFEATACNNKLIGARYYIDGFLDEFALDDNEFISPKDADGHGTHIASTAAGNVVPASLRGKFVANISGVAPRAHVAVYKACWVAPGDIRGSCSTVDLTRAIDDAVADGVDIINYSVGSDDDINDADDIALLAATEAGVLAIAAAGNEGPAPESVLSPAAAPWVLAVGASSRRGSEFKEALRITAPDSVKNDYAAIEAGFTPPLTDTALSLDLVLANDQVIGTLVERDGTPVTGTTIDGCEPIVNTAALSGQIALIRRGLCDFEVKVRNAQNAGAKAVVVFSDQGGPVIMRGTRGTVTIPAVMISKDDGDLLRARLDAEETVKITLQKGLFLTLRDAGNQMQGFSARGPSFWEADILKPDLTAPGVTILAGHTPDVANNVQGERFQYLSGTSMAVPHVAGLAALLKQAHPDWSPAALRSALMTTARQDILKEDGETPADPFDFGSGHAVPNRAISPGLVYELGIDDYDAFLCGRGEERIDGTDCATLESEGFTFDARDLNLPSIAVSGLVGEQVVRRRVTNVGQAAQFAASVEAPSTLSVTVTPSLLSLGSGESADFEVRIASAGATFDAWHFGALTWSAGETTVRSPLAVRPVEFGAPLLLQGDGATGNGSFDLSFGYTGSYAAILSGLEDAGEGQPADLRAALSGRTVVDDPDDEYVLVNADETPPDHVARARMIVPPGTRYLRIALDPGAGADDLDLYLLGCPGFGECLTMADPGISEGSDEVIVVVPEEGEEFVTAGEYVIDVHGYDVTGIASFNLLVWTVGENRGNATLSAPSSVTPGQVAEAGLEWTGLSEGLKIGLITHTDGTSILGQTLLEVLP